MKTLSTLAVVVASSLFCSCASIEGLGLVPRARVSIPVSPELSTDQLFTCVEQTVEQTSAVRVGWWFSTKTTLRNVEKGILEAGDFGDSGIAGLRVRAVISVKPRFVELTFKGAGPYYSNLHVDQVMLTLEQQFKQCSNT